VVGGALLAVCALIRPAFAAYIAAAVVILEVAAGRPRFGALRASAPALLLFFGSAALAGAAAWILLYRRIPPTVALDATVFAPARLMGSGGARYLQPDFLELGGNLLAGLAWAVAAGAGLFAICVIWAATPPVSGRSRFALACVGSAGALPLVLA